MVVIKQSNVQPNHFVQYSKGEFAMKRLIVSLSLIATILFNHACAEQQSFTLAGRKHECVTSELCWDNEGDLLVIPDKTALTYIEGQRGRLPEVFILERGIYQAWVKLVYAKVEGNIAVTKTLEQVDAKNRRIRRLSYYGYDKDDRVIESSDTPGEWQHFPPGSIGDIIMTSIIELGQFKAEQGQERYSIDLFKEMESHKK